MLLLILRRNCTLEESMDYLPRNRWYRLFEILPGALTWIILISPIVLAYKYPRPVAIFITLYVLLWFLRSMKLSIFLISAYRTYRKFEKYDWIRLLKFFDNNPPYARGNFEHDIIRQINFLKSAGKFKQWTDIYHVVIIATYKEEKEILEQTVSAVAESDFPKKQIIVVLATEERDRKNAQANADLLTEKFKNSFGGFYHFMHPENIAGEIVGKGPNIVYAGKKIAEVLASKNITPSNVLITTLDADNRPHPMYFSNLAFHYLMEPERKTKSFQPLPFFYNNIWEVPVWNRIVALANSFWHLSQSAQTHNMRNFSAHAQSLEALIETDFWSCHTIVEDGHQFWRSFFAFNGKHKVIPLFIPIYQDAVQNKSYFSTLKGQYIQLRRWAWGASDIPYAIMMWWKKRKQMQFFKTLWWTFQLIEGHVMWATAPIIISFTSYIPKIVNRDYSNSLFAYNLGKILSVYFTISLAGIVISLWVSLLTLPPHPRGKARRLFSILQWIFLPLVTVFFGALPAIDSQTRLMLGKPLEFTVTEKVRLNTTKTLR